EDAGVPIALQVDGGVATDTIERAAEAGADVFVAGSAVYAAENPAQAIDQLRPLARGAQSQEGKHSMQGLIDLVKWTMPVGGGGLLMRVVFGNEVGLASVLGRIRRQVSASPV